MSITSLPPEILPRILLSLDAKDILNLGHCMPLLITKEVYHHAFHESTQFAHYDMEMFRRRAEAKLYVLGNSRNWYGKGGDPQHFECVYQCRRMYRPQRVETECVTDVSLIGSVPRLLVNGDVYVINEVSKSERTEDVLDNLDKDGAETEMRATTNDLQPRIQRVENPRISEDLITPLEFPDISGSSTALFGFYHVLNGQPRKPTRTVSLGQGYPPCALDENGVLWKYESGVTLPLCLLLDGEVLNGRIRKVCPDPIYFTCRIDGLGIALLHRDFFNDGDESEYPSRGVRLCAVQTRLVPNTAHIRDYVVIGQSAVYLSEGKVEVVPFLRETASYVLAVNEYGPLLQIAGLGRTLAAITTNNSVVTVSEGQSVRVYHFSSHIVSISVGGDHFLALTEEGDVYSWGKECYLNGCLGLGRFKDAVSMEGVKCEDYTNLIATNPTRVSLPGKALAVFADYDISAVLLNEDDKDSETVEVPQKSFWNSLRERTRWWS